MADPTQLSGAHAILLATRLCASGSTSSLPALQARFPATLTTERLLRIVLTFLPESTAPESYTPIIEALVDGSNTDSHNVDISPVRDVFEAEARKRVRKIRLLQLRYPGDKDSEGLTDLLTIFLIHRAYRIDSETSLQPLIFELFLPFHQRSPVLRTWLISLLLPLLRLNYEYYPNQDKSCSVETLDSLDDQTATNILLSMSGTRKTDTDLVRNLRGLVGPWMYGSNRPRRQQFSRSVRRNSICLSQMDSQSQDLETSGWEFVNEWLLSRSLVDPEAVVNAFINWDGPEDVDLGGYVDEPEILPRDQLKLLRYQYGQTGLAVIYQSPEVSTEGSLRILERVSNLLEFGSSFFTSSASSAPTTIQFDANPIQSASRATLFQNALLAPSNPLTYPSSSSISFLSGLLLSLRILEELGHPIPCRTATNICLHSNQDMQLFELRSVMASVAQSQSGRDWKTVRQQLLWLRDWKSETDRSAENEQSCHGLFYKVPLDVIEAEILKVLLEVRGYDLAVDIYVQSSSALTPTQTEDAVKESIYAAYDNASNGNRNRGKMQKAHEILQAFLPHFPNSTSLKEAQALIAATHALSFYSLTLQHGVPFQPVSIRVHPDPLSLIDKVLDQNPRSYTKLDDFLSIGRNLVLAGFPPRPADETDPHPHSHYTRRPVLTRDEALITAERRIMSLAISSALSSDDFGTAYSYILTRLTPPSTSTISTSSTPPQPTIKDTITWRTVYNAGRYRPASTPQTPPTLQSQIIHLTQKMELLSLSLLLTPTPDPLPEILGAWRRADEELSLLRTRESLEEDAWDSMGDRTATHPSRLPGGFASQFDTEADAFETQQQHARRAARAAHHNRLDSAEAPMGLFEVARGAARALHKNVNSTFPLRSNTNNTDTNTTTPTSASMSSSMSFVDGGDGDDEENGEGRVRKRDMVSNMVTGGLASGIGWVLGAQPVNMNQRQ
ncbi:Sec39 domain-containing protein [Aspergillus venezuelensis]